MHRCPLKRLLFLLISWPLLAQTTDGPKVAAPPPNLIFKFGGQVDSTQGKDVLGKVTWNANSALTLFLSGNQSSLASTTQAPSASGNPTTTTITSLGGSYLFGLFDLGLQYDHSNMSDLLTSRRYYLQPAFDGGSWRVGFEGSIRTTDFDRLHFTGRTINTPTGPVAVTGYADLSIRDTGLGANVEWNGEIWRAYASYTHFNYGSFEGNTDVTRIRNASGAVSAEVFKALSDWLVNRLERLAGSRLSSKAALLDSAATVGLEANLKRTRWTLEVSQDLDHLTNQTSDTYTGIADWKVTPKFTLELLAGATRSDALGTNRFAGLTFIFRTRPSL